MWVVRNLRRHPPGNRAFCSHGAAASRAGRSTQSSPRSRAGRGVDRGAGVPSGSRGRARASGSHSVLPAPSETSCSAVGFRRWPWRGARCRPGRSPWGPAQGPTRAAASPRGGPGQRCRLRPRGQLGALSGSRQAARCSCSHVLAVETLPTPLNLRHLPPAALLERKAFTCFYLKT